MTRAFFHRDRRPGFSLVEVLVAVLVLALGLLGLGAVFPVVLREQRISTETTLGLSAQNAALPILASHGDFRPGADGWEALREFAAANQPLDGAWTPIPVVEDDLVLFGGYAIDYSGGTIYLPLAQRLYPLPFASEAEPRFVWDLAVRLIDPASPDQSEIMVAMFLRPIDPGIKPGILRGGQRPSVTEALVDSNLPARNRRFAASVDNAGNPTFDGRTDRGAQYAAPIVGRLSASGIPDAPLDQCVLDQSYTWTTGDDVARRLLGTIGQRFIDRRGAVYRVIRVDQDSIVTLSPALPDVDGSGDLSSSDLDAANPVIFLPQVSAIEPHVFTVKP